MRIVSLVPAATEMAFALGAGESVVAVTHDDDYPPAVGALPRVTRSTIPERATAREIDHLVRAAAARGESTFHLDQAALTEARPDVILGQTLCAVCAVTLDRVPAFLDRPPHVVTLDASTIAGMLDDLRRVGETIGRTREAEDLVRRVESFHDRPVDAVPELQTLLDWRLRHFMDVTIANGSLRDSFSSS